jgi:hypothetical protein
MNSAVLRILRRPFAIAATTMLLAACDETPPLAPERDAGIEAQFAKQIPQKEIDLLVAKLRRETDRYHDIDVAIADGFVHVHDCEVRPGEGAAGMVYAHPARMMDGLIRPALPDGLLYEPSSTGKPKLVGVELIMPYSLWTRSSPPTFYGATFQPEDEFGVFGLHVWVWRQNPAGLFAQAHAGVSCDA